MNNLPKITHEMFTAKVHEKISDLDVRDCIDTAYRLAKEAHRRQNRESGERYFEHVKRAAWILLTESTITDQIRLKITIPAILLHDMLEDTHMAEKRHLESIFDSHHKEIAQVAWAMKKKTKEEESDPIKRFCRLFESDLVATRIAKCCDRIDNLRDIFDCSTDKILRKVKETREVILPWLRDHSYLDDHDISAFHREQFKAEVTALANIVEHEANNAEAYTQEQLKK